MDCLVIGCGLSGSVIAHELSKKGKKVVIWERRNHIGGNLYDYVDEHGFLVQKYGPHVFHTSKKECYDYLCQFGSFHPYKLVCGAVWDGKYTPTPFNFTTIDTFYSKDKAENLKRKLISAFSGRKSATVLEVLEFPDEDIFRYAEYLFENDYAPYTAKQWGISPKMIDPSVLKRVPLRFSYEDRYFDDLWEVMPSCSYTSIFEKLLESPNIRVILNVEAMDHISIQSNQIYIDGTATDIPVIYTGALDELFGCIYGRLPYRSLRFEWKYSTEDSVQAVPVVAYPQAVGYTRITEYKKLPKQKGAGTSYALEYPIAYEQELGSEPYYPVLTAESQKCYQQYRKLAECVPQLYCCGRLADFKYYNMDQALENAVKMSKGISFN